MTRLLGHYFFPLKWHESGQRWLGLSQTWLCPLLAHVLIHQVHGKWCWRRLLKENRNQGRTCDMESEFFPWDVPAVCSYSLSFTYGKMWHSLFAVYISPIVCSFSSYMVPEKKKVNEQICIIVFLLLPLHIPSLQKEEKAFVLITLL